MAGVINVETDEVEYYSYDACSVKHGFCEARTKTDVELIPRVKRIGRRKRRNPEDWSYTNIPENLHFDRGYTGHEHLDAFSLINMNGRMYDSQIGRFLSPDIIIANPANTQSYNRYSYCLNNPLLYTDPSGYVYGMHDRWGNKFYVDVTNGGGNNIQYTEKDHSDGRGGGGGGSGGESNVTYSVTYNFEVVSQRDANGNLQIMNIRYEGYTITDASIDDWNSYWNDLAANSGGGETDNSYLGFAGWSALTQWTGAVSNAQVGSLKSSQAILNEMHGLNSILINSKTVTWLKVGQTAKFLGFAGNLAGMVPTALDIRANGLNADNLLDGIISGSSFVPVFGWVLSPTFQAYKNNVEKRIAAGEGEEVIRSMEILIMMNCFAEGTQVLMGDRTLKNIELVEIGDTVLTYNFTQKKLEMNPVVEINKPVHYKLVKAVFSNGVEIISTEDHPYYVKGKGWCSFNPEQTSKNYGIETKQLEVSDYCLTFKNSKLKKVKVTQIVPFEESIKTYNLTGIAKSNNYFVNGILVNNESSEIPLNNNTQKK